MELPWADWQFWLVTGAAACGIVVVVRPFLPSKRRDEESACSSCAVGAAAQAAREHRESESTASPPG